MRAFLYSNNVNGFQIDYRLLDKTASDGEQPSLNCSFDYGFVYCPGWTVNEGIDKAKTYRWNLHAGETPSYNAYLNQRKFDLF